MLSNLFIQWQTLWVYGLKHFCWWKKYKYLKVFFVIRFLIFGIVFLIQYLIYLKPLLSYIFLTNNFYVVFLESFGNCSFTQLSFQGQRSDSLIIFPWKRKKLSKFISHSCLIVSIKHYPMNNGWKCAWLVLSKCKINDKTLIHIFLHDFIYLIVI